MNTLLFTAAVTATSGVAAAAATGWALTAGRLRRRTRALALEHDRVIVAEHDGLTGLWRRDAFELLAPAALARGNAVALLDLDGFKLINDTFGHPVGDEVLRVIAERLTVELGENALLTRLGGDEFGAIAALEFPAVHAQLQQLAGALTAPVTVEGVGNLTVGVSLGIAWLCDLPTADTSAGTGADRARDSRFWADVLREGLAAADAAMYAAKALHHDWRLYDRALDPVRPAAEINLIPAQRYREHGPDALRDTASPSTGSPTGPRGSTALVTRL